MQIYFLIKSIFLGCPSEKIVLKQREESNIFILHLLTIRYKIGIHTQKHGNLHKYVSDITIPLFIAANTKLRKKKWNYFSYKVCSYGEFLQQQQDLHT